MKILIERYRGFEIEFDTNYEKFQCIVSDEDSKESKSFSAVKKYIDQYIKENKTFKEFYIETIPKNIQAETENKIKVVGVRKDGVFVIEKSDGKKETLSKYREDYYMLSNEHNKEITESLKKLSDEIKSIERSYREKFNLETAKLVVTTLSDYRKNLNISQQ